MATRKKPPELYDDRMKDLLIEALDQGIQNVAIIGIDGTVIYCNNAFAQAHGRTSDEVTGEHVSIFHSPDQMADVEKINESILKKGSFRGEVWHTRADGSVFPTSMFNTLIKDTEGKTVGMIGTFQDISSQKERLERIEYLSSVIRSLRNVDRLITREKDPSCLIRSTCNVLTEVGGYRYSWILLIDSDGRVFDSAESVVGSACGSIQEMIESDHIPPCASMALEKPGLVLRSDISDHCKLCRLDLPELEEVEGFTIRLEHDGEVFGVISAGLPLYYGSDEENQLLFEEIAEDISYALYVIRVEKERLKSSGDLRESQLLLSTFSDHFPGAAFIRDSNSRYLQVNKYFTETFGDEEHWIGRIPQELVSEDLALQMIESDRTALDEGYSFVEKMVHDKDGNGLMFEVHSFRIDRDGKSPLIGGIGIDITERSVSDSALRESEERYRAVFENTGTATVIVNTDTTILLANRGFERLSGYSREELCGQKSWTEFVTPEDRKRMKAFYAAKKNLTRSKPNEYEFHFVDRTRNIKDVHLSVNMIPGTDNAVSSLLDITEFKNTQKQLIQSLHNTQTLLKAMPDMMFVISSEGNIQDYWVENDEELAVPADRVTGSNIRDLDISRQKMDEIFSAIESALSSGEVQSVEYDLRLDEDLKHFEARIAPYDSGSVISVIRDISMRKHADNERRLLEAQIQHTQKLESLGVLAGGIAHDFNNILMAILGNADLAADSVPDSSPARIFLKEIANAATRAADLARQMLAYSGRSTFEFAPLKLNDIVMELTHMLEVSISKKAVLKYRLAEKLPLIEADATQIRQILMNLITNASEALGDKSGIISLTTGAMHCDTEYLNGTEFIRDLKEDYYVYIEVADTGEGMDESVKSQLFDPFFTTKFTGRGLGLSAVLGIIRGHKGTIKVYSEPGEGSTFKILFPIYEGAEDSLPDNIEENDIRNWKGSGTILFADDEDTVLAVGRRMLENFGFTVLTAGDGRIAVDVFRDNSDDIILAILDLTMPHLSGDEVYREIRRIRKDVPVIVSSGFSEQDISHRFAGKQLAGFIQKPYRSAELATKIREVLG